MPEDFSVRQTCHQIIKDGTNNCLIVRVNFVSEERHQRRDGACVLDQVTFVRTTWPCHASDTRERLDDIRRVPLILPRAVEFRDEETEAAGVMNGCASCCSFCQAVQPRRWNGSEIAGISQRHQKAQERVICAARATFVVARVHHRPQRLDENMHATGLQDVVSHSTPHGIVNAIIVRGVPVFIDQHAIQGTRCIFCGSRLLAGSASEGGQRARKASQQSSQSIDSPGFNGGLAQSLTTVSESISLLIEPRPHQHAVEGAGRDCS